MLVDPKTLEPYVELGLSRDNHSEFVSFRSMWLRLHGKSSVGRYDHVMVDPRWVSFKKFLLDMGKKPEGLTLDRIDSSGGYCRENCRWATDKVQSQNRRNTYWITDGEETLTLKDMCLKIDSDYRTIHARVRAGWPIDEALSTPISGLKNHVTSQRLSFGRYRYVPGRSNRF